MPRKSNNTKAAKRAKLSGIARFFKDKRQDEQASTASSLSSSNSDSNLTTTSTADLQQSRAINVDSLGTSSFVGFAENNEQSVSCAATSLPSVEIAERPSSEASSSSGLLASYSCTSPTTSPLSTLNAKSNNLLSLEKPNQPDVSVIPSQKTSMRTLYFQKKWYKDYGWIHYDPDLKKVLCFYCSKASAMGITDFARCKEPAFISQGFNNWKKAIEKFQLHQKSHAHQLAINQVAAVRRPSVRAQIFTQKQKEQLIARNSLLKLLTSIRYLLRQGSAFRGHEESEGNYLQLLKLRSEDVPDLQVYLRNTTNFIITFYRKLSVTLRRTNFSL